MLRYYNYEIVFQEVPDEVSLAINITGCPNKCKGCHSPHLIEDIGYSLEEAVVTGLLKKYKNAITCVCFMGGDSNPKSVEHLSFFVKETTDYLLKTAWYSGRDNLPQNCIVDNFNYIKLGAYIDSLGGLNSPNTNQRFYKIVNGAMIDNSHLFRKKKYLFENWNETGSFLENISAIKSVNTFK